MASSPKSTLVTLLIISAIDLLLCSFTMGVMLFLIFQPSQRSDRGSAITQSSLGSRSASQGVGARDGPAVIVVENLGENRLAAVNIPSGYREVGSSKDPGRTLAFAAYTGDQPSSLILESRRGTGRQTEALISIAKGGNLITQAVHCRMDADASVALSEKPVIKVNCRSPPIFCPIGSYPLGQSSTDRQKIDRQNAAVVVLGRDSEGTIRAANGRLCLASPTFDDVQLEKWDVKISKELATTAKSRCNVTVAAGFNIASDDKAECVFDAPGVIVNDRWLIDCFDKQVTLRKQNEDTAYILFMGDDGAGVCSQVDIAN